jgi:hypothetical protein
MPCHIIAFQELKYRIHALFLCRLPCPCCGFLVIGSQSHFFSSLKLDNLKEEDTMFSEFSFTSFFTLANSLTFQQCLNKPSSLISPPLPIT